MYKKEIAGKEEVLDRAVKNLQTKYDIYISKDIMKEVYDSTVAYIRKRKKEIPFCSIKLGEDLGRAYWTQVECNTKKNNAHNRDENNNRTDNYNLWKKRSEIIEESYQNNQPGVNVKPQHMNFHVIKPLIKSLSRRGYIMEEVEKIQNSI